MQHGSWVGCVNACVIPAIHVGGSIYRTGRDKELTDSFSLWFVKCYANGYCVFNLTQGKAPMNANFTDKFLSDWELPLLTSQTSQQNF